MTLLRKLNDVLGTATGFEVRRARPRGAASAARLAPVAAKALPGSKAAAKPKSQPLPYREPADPETDRLLRQPVFIMASVRSGSTLLRLLLNAHSQLHAPHELHFRRLEVACSTSLAERSMAALDLKRSDLEHLLWDRVLHRELQTSGKRFLVEKTPSNAFVCKRIAACWPDARFLFLLRHPASVARSWHEVDPRKRSAEEAMFDSLRYMNAVERARKSLTGHVVRYEDLTGDPTSTMKGICAFLGLDFEPEMLDYGSKAGGDFTKGLGDWKDKIKSGAIQPGRELPSSPGEIPGPLREICRAWGYSDAAELVSDGGVA